MRGMEPWLAKKIYVRKRDARVCPKVKETPSTESLPGLVTVPISMPPQERKEPPAIRTAPALLQEIYCQALPKALSGRELEAVHRGHFSAYIQEGQYLERLSPELTGFDLEMLADALRLERDDLFPRPACRRCGTITCCVTRAG